MGIVCKITGHKWNKLPDGSDGCKCTRCGRVRDEGHDWQKATANFGAKEHRRQCRICGRYETERHSFKLLPNCQRMCTVCGYTMTWHEFRRGECMTCGIDESNNRPQARI